MDSNINRRRWIDLVEGGRWFRSPVRGHAASAHCGVCQVEFQPGSRGVAIFENDLACMRLRACPHCEVVLLARTAARTTDVHGRIQLLTDALNAQKHYLGTMAPWTNVLASHASARVKRAAERLAILRQVG